MADPITYGDGQGNNGEVTATAWALLLAEVQFAASSPELDQVEHGDADVFGPGIQCEAVAISRIPDNNKSSGPEEDAEHAEAGEGAANTGVQGPVAEVAPHTSGFELASASEDEDAELEYMLRALGTDHARVAMDREDGTRVTSTASSAKDQGLQQATQKFPPTDSTSGSIEIGRLPTEVEDADAKSEEYDPFEVEDDANVKRCTGSLGDDEASGPGREQALLDCGRLGSCNEGSAGELPRQSSGSFCTTDQQTVEEEGEDESVDWGDDDSESIHEDSGHKASHRIAGNGDAPEVLSDSAQIGCCSEGSAAALLQASTGRFGKADHRPNKEPAESESIDWGEDDSDSIPEEPHHRASPVAASGDTAHEVGVAAQSAPAVSDNSVLPKAAAEGGTIGCRPSVEVSTSDGSAEARGPGSATRCRYAPPSGHVQPSLTAADWWHIQSEFRALPKLPRPWIYARSRSSNQVYCWNMVLAKACPIGDALLQDDEPGGFWDHAASPAALALRLQGQHEGVPAGGSSSGLPDESDRGEERASARPAPEFIPLEPQSTRGASAARRIADSPMKRPADSLDRSFDQAQDGISGTELLATTRAERPSHNEAEERFYSLAVRVLAAWPGYRASLGQLASVNGVVHLSAKVGCNTSASLAQRVLTLLQARPEVFITGKDGAHQFVALTTKGQELAGRSPVPDKVSSLESRSFVGRRAPQDPEGRESPRKRQKRIYEAEVPLKVSPVVVADAPAEEKAVRPASLDIPSQAASGKGCTSQEPPPKPKPMPSRRLREKGSQVASSATSPLSGPQACHGASTELAAAGNAEPGRGPLAKLPCKDGEELSPGTGVASGSSCMGGAKTGASPREVGATNAKSTGISPCPPPIPPPPKRAPRRPPLPPPPPRPLPPLHVASPPVQFTPPKASPDDEGLQPSSEGPPPCLAEDCAEVPDWKQYAVPGRVLARRRSGATFALPSNVNECSEGELLGTMELPACDNEGRPFDLHRVVVNFVNVGTTYGERVLSKHKSSSRLFDYEGVRLCVEHLSQKLGLAVIGVVYENLGPAGESSSGNVEAWQVPDDIMAMCESIELTPWIIGHQHRSAVDEMTIKCAYRRNCRFLDNDNYSDWRSSLHDDGVRSWLTHCQEFLQMRFFFDTGLGTFDTLDGNLPAAMLVPGTVIAGDGAAIGNCKS